MAVTERVGVGATVAIVVAAAVGCADGAGSGCAAESDGAPSSPVIVAGAAREAAREMSRADPASHGSVVLPDVISIPHVVAGGGGAITTVVVSNPGPGRAAGIEWRLRGHPRLHFGGGTPEEVAAGERVEVELVYDGSAEPEIAGAVVSATFPDGAAESKVWAVAGDPSIGPASWEAVEGAGGVSCGDATTIALPSAPFPQAGTPWSDASVRVFVPEGYRDMGTHDVVVHFHGWTTTVGATLGEHHYQEHLYASGANAILVVPQGPVNAQSGDFGKLMQVGGLEALVRDVLSVGYRDGRIRQPVLGDVVLTSHSGGYLAVASNLSNPAPAVREAALFDSMYGQLDTYEQYVRSGGRLVSTYAPGAATETTHAEMGKRLAGLKVPFASSTDRRSLRDAPAVMGYANTSHERTTRLDGIYGEALRFGLQHHRRGPRIELRQATARGGTAKVSWLSPRDTLLEGFMVEVSGDGETWEQRAKVGAEEESATFAFTGGARVRVVPLVAGLSSSEVIPSDAGRMDTDATVLVVDGFDRVLGGSFGGLRHDFAAWVGEASGGCQTASHRALGEDGVSLAEYPVVVWLLGDESSDDLSVSEEEQALLTAYLKSGGRLVLSGSEVAYDLDGVGNGSVFIRSAFGAALREDNATSGQASGVGRLDGLGPFVFVGEGRPYGEDHPDSLLPLNGAEILLQYANGQPAAVGIRGRSALVGFPVELVDAGSLPVLMRALLRFVRE